MKFELFQFAHYVEKTIYSRVLILKWLLSSLKEPSRREEREREEERKEK
jgi:hypothetical protein